MKTDLGKELAKTLSVSALTEIMEWCETSRYCLSREHGDTLQDVLEDRAELEGRGWTYDVYADGKQTLIYHPCGLIDAVANGLVLA